jgi:hypothetical protein
MPAGPRTVRALPRFLKSKRRLPPDVQTAVDTQVKALLDTPLAGEPKTGALKGVRVFKFKVHDRQYLLAYHFFAKPNVLEVIDIGVHENFYRELHRYLDAR